MQGDCFLSRTPNINISSKTFCHFLDFLKFTEIPELNKKFLYVKKIYQCILKSFLSSYPSSVNRAQKKRGALRIVCTL